MMPTDQASDDRTNGDGLVAYIGYGSLVNRTTLRTDYVSARRVRLHGWRRCWRPRMNGDPIRSKRRTSLLSARRVEESAIEGLLVFDRLENLPAVDERERTYDRIEVPSDAIEVLDDGLPDCPVFVYEARTNRAEHDPHHPILQSYLDAVLQGFLREFGKIGVHSFLDTTDGFERSVHADRHDPVYPRAVELLDHERHYIDTVLEQRGMCFV